MASEGYTPLIVLSPHLSLSTVAEGVLGQLYYFVLCVEYETAITTRRMNARGSFFYFLIQDDR